jgi:SAM-dependent methyltransferase
MKFAQRPIEVDPVRQVGASRRLNVGCGQYPILYWTNLDADPKAIADIYQCVPPLPFGDESLEDIYAGHFLEHLPRDEGRAFLAECFRCLIPGGRLGVLVPDTREIVTRWLRGDLDCIEYPVGVWHAINDLDDLCALFFYHTADPTDDSPHVWSYDLGTLRRALEGAGFTVTGEIDRYRDPRIPVGAFYQCGWDAIKPSEAK